MSKQREGSPGKLLTIQEVASMGGKARAAALSASELSKQGRSAVMARWKKRKKKRDPASSS